MPLKYHIPSAPIANRFPKITKSGVIAWEEGCLKCARCVKKDCVYKVYEKRDLDERQMLDALDSVCMDCFRCVQGCPNRLIQKGMNPTYKTLGDRYWTPEIISDLWFQAETGRIPVSGAGYGGFFSGIGFDTMWTDMSEIVRPTRDGIHGREYISTTVDLGRKLMMLNFNDAGEMLSVTPPLVEIPLPVIFDFLPWSPPKERIIRSMLKAAKMLGTFLAVRASDFEQDMIPDLPNIMLHLDRQLEDIDSKLIETLRIIEIPYNKDTLSIQHAIKEINPSVVTVIRLPLDPGSSARILELIKDGAEVVHLCADEHGLEKADNPLFIKDRIKEIHLRLVENGVRDQITLLAGGGIAMAEHMAKIIICGADALTIDIPLLVAMECRSVDDARPGLNALSNSTRLTLSGCERIKNLMAGWHNQLLEILGAMGIRK
jgi:hypothetical protein